MTKAAFPRDILNRLKWEEGESLADAKIVVLHRGAPEDRIVIDGRDVVSIGHIFFETREVSIPFHRIMEIWHRGERIFEKTNLDKRMR